jgi:probable F420-dependent oxidoreductase
VAQVRVGVNLFFLLDQLLGDAEGLARLEELGFDSLWTGDHLYVPRYGASFDAFTVLAALAARTRNPLLGAGVVILPLRPPALTAREAATVDLISRGRLVLGVGVGGEFPWEFAACGVPLQGRGRRADDAILVLRRLWRGEVVTHAGPGYRLDSFRLQPLPWRQGGPPIWVGGRSPAALGRAGRLADGFLPWMFSPERYREALSQVRRHAAEAGRDPDAVVPGLFAFVALARDRDEGESVAASHLERLYGRPLLQAVRHCVPCGTPDDCVGMLSRFLAAGARHLVLSPICPPDQVWRHLHLLAIEVAPRLRGWTGPH